MDNSRSDPVCITASVNEVFAEQCSLDERIGEWPELEQFWGEEKQRLQDLDGQTRPMSNSLEKQLLHEDFINEPKPRKESVADLKIIRGDEIKDIPTSYMIGGFKPHDLIVIGTYVDKNIIPGFQYKVRKNPGEEYLFNGRALHLENVGQGYGKRLTFQGESLNENSNYFWSDSQVHGFAFTFQAINKDDVFTILDTTTNEVAGRVIVNTPALVEDLELSTSVKDGGRIEKRVQVNFSCDIILSDVSNRQNIFLDDVPVKGEAVLVRDCHFSMAKVEEIVLHDFIMEACQLLPEK